ILVDYFKANAQEAMKMIKFEYSFKDELRAARGEGMEKGLDYVLELMAQGLSNEEIKKKIKKAKTSSKLQGAK
ncbi:MAG: hypothetical protein FWH53_05580, partial [Leptospirales bacterium]|nr:hypothetical protein [Leptospirales bacterium]